MHVFVVNVGQPAYAQYTLPFIRDYCRRCAYDLTIFDEPPSDGRPAQWQKMLAHEIVPNEHLLILDLDVVPQPHAPPIHQMVDRSKMSLVAERRREHRMGTLNSLGFPAEGVVYNTGVISSPFNNAELFANIYQQQHLDATGEQLFVNLEVAKQKIPVSPLDRRWNWSITNRFSPAKHAYPVWFIHFAGNSNRRYKKSRELWEYWYGDVPRKRGHARILCEKIKETIGEPSFGAEVGVANGGLSAALLATFSGLKLRMIDAWDTYAEDHLYYRSGDYRARLSNSRQNDVMNEAQERTAFAGDRAHLIRADSTKAALRIADESLDFAFIDADHTLEGVRRDLASYYPKIRRGGLFTGHDYGHRRFVGVKQAVDSFASQEKLDLVVEEDVWSIRKP